MAVGALCIVVAATGIAVATGGLSPAAAAGPPLIALAKSATISNFSGPGTSITYDYQVTNTGGVTLTAVHVTDAMPGLSSVTCPHSTLAPAADETCTATYTTTQADVDAGGITNTGVATGTPPTGPDVTDSSTLTIPSTQNASIGVVASASISTFSEPGIPITLFFEVTDTGNVTLASVNVTDALPGLSAVTCPDPTLAPAADEVCTASYTTTQSDVDAGGITSTGVSSGTPPNGPGVTASSSLTIPANQSASIQIVKSATVGSFSEPGTPITYKYHVTNNGIVTLTTVTVTDPMPGLSAITCPDSTLAPAADEICTAAYTTTQGDVDAGGITNTGTATGTPPVGPAVTATSLLTIESVRTPSISIEKSANVTSFSGVGTPITYSYTVTNTGNVILTSVSVTDPMPGLSAVSCPGPTLAPSADETCTATYTTTAANVTARKIVNTGTATGTPPAGPDVNARETLTIPFTAPSCFVGPWPTKVSGDPVFTHRFLHTPEGFYLGVVNNQWMLRVSHPSSKVMLFSGTLVTNGTFTNVDRLMNEGNDTVVVVHADQINFSFHKLRGPRRPPIHLIVRERIGNQEFQDQRDGRAPRQDLPRPPHNACHVGTRNLHPVVLMRRHLPSIPACAAAGR